MCILSLLNASDAARIRAKWEEQIYRIMCNILNTTAAGPRRGNFTQKVITDQFGAIMGRKMWDLKLIIAWCVT